MAISTTKKDRSESTDTPIFYEALAEAMGSTIQRAIDTYTGVRSLPIILEEAKEMNR